MWTIFACEVVALLTLLSSSLAMKYSSAKSTRTDSACTKLHRPICATSDRGSVVFPPTRRTTSHTPPDRDLDPKRLPMSIAVSRKSGDSNFGTT